MQAAPNRQLTIKPTLQKLNAENNELMHIAKRACISYLKCVHLMKDKEVFKFKEVDAQKLAESLGLATTPEINFGQNDSEIQITNTMSRAEQKAARIQILREQSRQRKKENMEKRQQQLWAQVPEGSSLDSDSNDEGNKDEDDTPAKVDNKDLSENDESDDEIMKPVPKEKQFWDKDEESVEIKEPQLKVSKHKLRKITKDGPFGGKNRQMLDGDGKALSSLDALKEE